MKKFLSIIIIIICFIIFIYSSYMIVNWHLSNKENKKIKEEVDSIIKNDKDNNKVIFEEIKKINSDVVAYLKVNNTNIDYIVVKGNDNDYYLNHNLKREYNVSGWIFADYNNRFDGTDKNIIIYGHNTKDGSMFGSLKNVLSKSWQQNDNNLNITLITEGGEEVYRVFSVYQIKAENYYIKTYFMEGEFKTFVDNLKKRSIYDFNVGIDESDSIITLSTCSENGDERVVVHAKKVKN